MSIVRAISVSGNTKTGMVSATYLTQASCPSDCPFLHSGCYAEVGRVGIMTSRLNATTGRLSPAQIAQKEAEAIDQLSGQLDLRLHIVGDCRTRRAAQITATASERYIARSHRYGSPRKVWTYTHAWRKVERSDWKSVSVLASCETTEDVRHARSKGYATAIVVDKFKKKSAYEIAEGLKVIPCPQQTTGVTCVECRLCMKDQHLKDRNLTIAFEAHSISKQKVKDKLMTLNMVNDS